MSNSINLLAPSTIVRKRNIPGMYSKLLVAGCVLAVLLISTVSAGFYVLNRQLDEQLMAVNHEIKAMGKAAEQAAADAAVKASFNDRVKDVISLQKDRPVLSAYLDELLKITPAAVQLTNIELKSNPVEITLKGTVSSHIDTAQLGRNLERSVLFKDSIIALSEKELTTPTVPGSTAQQKVTGGTRVNFVFSITPGKKGDKR